MILGRIGAGSEMKSIIEFHDITKEFGGLRALDSVSFNLRETEIRGLIGPNGSGKTTLINVATGIYPPTSGFIVFRERKYDHLAPNALVKYGMNRTFQNIRLFDSLTCLENVMVGRYRHFCSNLVNVLLRDKIFWKEEKEAEEKAMNLLEFVGIRHKAYDLSVNLSFGERRRLEIARALASDPFLLFLDEPTAGMVLHERKEIVELVKKIRNEGKAVVIVEHTMHVITSLCDNVTALNFGKKIAEGEPEKVLRNSEVIEAYLGKDEAYVEG